MRETVGTTTTMKIALAVTLLFTGFLAAAIVYNKAFKIKNESIAIIEKYEGMNKTSIEIINNYLKTNGYDTKGACAKGEQGVADLNSNTSEKVTSNNKKYYYCFSTFCPKSDDKKCRMKSNDQIYYSIRVFFKFNLPFLGDLATFKITGDTRAIKLYDQNQIYNK